MATPVLSAPRAVPVLFIVILAGRAPIVAGTVTNMAGIPTTRGMLDQASGEVAEIMVDVVLASDLLEVFNRMRLAGQQCDVQIQVNASGIKVHRIIMSAASTYFNEILDTKSTSKIEFQEVIVQTVHPEVMQGIVQFIYTGKIYVTEGNVVNILRAAKMFQLESLKKICGQFLSARLSSSNCVRVLMIADTMGTAGLREEALNYTRKMFEEVVLHDDVFNLSSKHLVEIVSSDNLNVSNEEIVYSTVAKWLDSDPGRAPQCHSVLKHVRLPFLPAAFLHEQVAGHGVINNSTACRALIENALWVKVLPELGKNDTPTALIRPRNSYDQVIRFGIEQCTAPIVYQHRSRTLKTFNARTGAIRQYLELPNYDLNYSLNNFAIAEFIGTLYLAGGNDYRSSRQDKFFKLDRANNWIRLADMQYGRVNFILLSLDSDLYAVGGDGNWPPTIEKYTPSKDKWEVVDRIP